MVPLRHIWRNTLQKALYVSGFLFQSLDDAKKVTPPFSEGLLFGRLNRETQGLDIPQMCRILSVEVQVGSTKTGKLVGHIRVLALVGS